MFKATLIVALGLLAHADQHTHDQINRIMAATQQFHQTIANWDGSYLGTMPILKQSYSLRSTLSNAMSAPSVMEAFRAPSHPELERDAMRTAQNLADEVGRTVDTALEKRPMMAAIPLVGKRVGRMIFQNLYDASKNLGTMFAPRAAEENREEAQEVVDKIQGHFERGLEAFDQMGIAAEPLLGGLNSVLFGEMGDKPSQPEEEMTSH